MDNGLSCETMELIAVAKILKPHGIRGDVKLQLLTDTSDRFDNLSTIWIGPQVSDVKEYKILSFRQDVKQCAVHFAGIDSIDMAEVLRNQFLFISEDKIVLPQNGKYFIDHILGCEIVTVKDEHLGKVEDVYRLPANDIWVVRNGLNEISIPAVKAIVRDVDIVQKRIVVDLPEGLKE